MPILRRQWIVTCILAWGTLATVGAQSLSATRERRSGHEAVADPRLGDFDVFEKTIPELQEAMQAGKVTARQLTALYLARIDAFDQHGPRLNSLIFVNPHALEAADDLDRERQAGRVRGPLHGIPVVVKDNFETADMPTTAGALALAGMETHRDAFQVKKLRDAGAIILAKANLDELAMGGSGISSLGGQTLNPYGLDRSPGGSSAGTGVAVAADLAAAGLGSDTCGSIRSPAANNNLFGLRPTMGLSSRRGIVPLAHTQDTGGPLARTVVDLALMLDATVGSDPDDAVTTTSAGHIPSSYRTALKPEALRGVRIGVLTAMFGNAPEDQEVAAIVRRAIDAMKAAGAEPIEVSVPGLETLLTGADLMRLEFKFDLIDYLAQVPSAPVKSLGEILDTGNYISAFEGSYKGQNAIESLENEARRRALIKHDMTREAVLGSMDENRLDVLVYPTARRKPAQLVDVRPRVAPATTPLPAPGGGAGTGAVVGGSATAGPSSCQLSASTGLPALSVPAGFTADGLPVGMDLMGRAFTEPQLLAMAYAYEQAMHPRQPPANTPALLNSKPPQPVSFSATARAGAKSAIANFQFNPFTGTLAYQVSATGLEPPETVVVTLHRGAAGEKGPVLRRLMDGATGSGAIVLPIDDRDALREGRLYLQAMPSGSPTAPWRTQVSLP